MAHAAEEFGDLSVSAAAMYSGNTFHGYAEMRVTLENRSLTKAHVVALAFPKNSYNNGNSIGHLARTVKLQPGAREIVSLLQPPLPVQGDGQIRVEVDGHHEGEVRAPNANNHCNNYSGRGGMATVFISRSLNFDEVEKLFQANSGAFTASRAVGAPDASAGRGGSGMMTSIWMPDNSRRTGLTNWLELDYATPQVVDKIVVYHTHSPSSSGSVTLLGDAGTNLAVIPMTAGRTSSSGSGMTAEFSFPATSEPVKTVRLDFGKTTPWSIGIDAVQIYSSAGSQWAASARASSDNSAAAGRSMPGMAGVDAVASLRAESPVSEWSENWLAYSPFDAVVLGATDLAAMSPAVLSALGDYLQGGGNLVVLGKKELPNGWHLSQRKTLVDGGQFKIGFGNCFLFGTDNAASLNAGDIQVLRDAVRDTARYWQGLPDDSSAANNVMPVVENLKIPTRGIVIVMLAFIILIGPVNMIYLTRRNRRTWMLWTIPVISLVTTLLVFAYSLLREGITPDTRIAGLTVIDQAGHHATTIGATAFYCPLTPSGGLHFDYGTEATPLVHIGYGSGTSREVDWTQGQHFSRGWVSARVPVHFHLRKSESRRERLQVVNEAGKLQVVNGLGANIKSLWVADADLNIYEARAVTAGQKGGLIRSTQLYTSGNAGAEGLLREITFAARTDSLDGIAVRHLQPNTYIAVLEGNPFLENALGAASRPLRTKSSSVVFGILESAK